MKTNPAVSEIREFNRFYTNTLGLLDQCYLNSGFSLSEVRVLHEIDTASHSTSKRLTEILCMDPGYLSRILTRAEKTGLIEKKASPEDKRSYLLYLTARGKEAISELHARSNANISGLIDSLPRSKQAGLVRNMSAIKQILSAEKRACPQDIRIRHKLKNGDIGYLIHMHGWIYARECRYPLAFEGYVAKTFYDFMKTYAAEKDRIWLAENGEEIVGSIAIVGHPEKAQLRWFLLHPDYRGIGLGSQLLKKALSYGRQKGYSRIFLTTTEDQKQAIAMYTRAGFVKVAERESHEWMENLMEYTFELHLN